MRRALVVLGLIGCGSKRTEAPPAVRTGTEPDKLWALAPPGAEGGVVVTPHGVAELAKAFVRVRAEIDAYPEFAIAKGQLGALAQVGLAGDKTLADIGIATDKGFAMFGTERDALLILPVADRQKFVAAMHGTTTGEVDQVFGVTCKQLPQGYACAKVPALLDTLGKGSLVGKLAADARGDAELWMSGRAMGKSVDALSIAAALDDGVLDVHAFVQTVQFATYHLTGLVPMAPEAKGGGYLLANFAPAIAQLPDGPQTAALRALAGPLAATMSSSELAFLARAPLADAAAFQQIVDHCDAVGHLLGLAMTPANGVCHITIPALVTMSIDAWVEHGELRIAQAKGEFDPGTGSERTAIGKALAEYPFAVWGRGSVFAVHLAKRLTSDAQRQLPELPAVLRAFSQISEIGFATKFTDDGVHARAYLRTTWANPSSVAEAIAGISAADTLSGKGDEVAASVAADHADAPFAKDLAAGPGGMMMPTTVLGILGAVAVPAFLDYMKKSKLTEAALQLDKLAKNAKVFYLTNAQFPKGVAALTPSTPCCGNPTNKCPPADWSADVWKALDFEISRPTLFQYSYASDGDSFNATAVGDLDCDGVFITYTMSGTAEHGNPRTVLSEPPANSD